MPFVFAQTDPGSATLLDLARSTSLAISNSWDTTWNSVLTSGVWEATVYLGVLFAVGSLGYFVIDWTRRVREDDQARAFSEWIWPVLALALLAGNGVLAREGVLGLRNLIVDVNDRVLATSANGNATLAEAFRDILNRGAAQGTAGVILSSCQGLTGDNQQACIERAKSEIAKNAQTYNRPWTQSFLDTVNGAIEGVRDATGWVLNPIGQLQNTVNSLLVQAVLLAFGMGFQQLLEVSLLLTAVLAPLAIGGSVLPIGEGKPLFAWLTGFFSIGLARICYSIIVGIEASVLSSAESTDPLYFAVFVGILSPILAFALAAGGGLAVWSGITSGVAAIFGAISFAKGK
jgi:nitrate reductase NapE component